MATDRISNLPDEVLGKILSLVPTKVAASTTVLSKRWRNSLVPLVDSLDFDELMLFYPDRKDRGEEATSHESCLRRRHRFSDFVDKTLAQLSTCPLIKKFSLTCECVDDIPRVNRWIRFALERGCLELNLKSWCTILIDSEFFTSKSLVKLTLNGEIHPYGGLLPCGGVFFPALKTLSLVSAPFSSLEMIKSFVEGCPALEELFVYEWVSYLWSPCVKRLTITSDFSYWHQLGGHTLKTPSLLYLDFSDYIVPSYDVSLHSLVEARLDIRLHVDPNEYIVDESDGDITSLIEGMSNIKSLQLTPHSLQVFYFCCPSMPLLNNLLSLSIEIDEKKGCWKAIPRLLDNSPNLQTLVIKGLVHIRKNKKMARCLSRCRVKVLEISGYKGSLGELKQMRLFLRKLECLETVKVGVEEGTNNSNYLLAADLMALPRVSSKCNIQFI